MVNFLNIGKHMVLMETATEKMTRLLLLYPEKKWKQAELAERSGCSKAFASKFTKKMVAEGILARPKPQEIMLLGGTKLLNAWCSMRKLPKPIYIKTNLSKPQIEKMLKKEKGCCLTLFSAAWHRIKFMKTERIEAYVEKSKAKKFIKKFGLATKNPTNFIIFPSDSHVFENSEKISGICLVNIVQNYADLISSGGTGMRVAYELGKKYNLRGV